MKQFFQRNKGQVTLAGTVLIGLITMIGGVVSARITANSTIDDKIAEVRQDTAVVAKTVDLNEKNSTARLDRLEDKIDWLIRQQGGIPGQIIQSK